MRLKIELRSDLCAAVGKHYAAMIDLDTALDENGIPFIPARRLKGCLREVAAYCSDDNTVNRIFGTSGSDIPGSLSLGNAYVENYTAFTDEIKHKKIPAEKVTELFCSVRGETAIENDTVKENSLRYIRVVNMTSPVTEKPLAFFADMDFDGNDAKLIGQYIGALRNIGYHRNRGLGLVSCSLEESDKKDGCVLEDNYDDCGALRITLRLDGDMMLPDTDANHSGDYITGTMLLGAIAAKYVKKYGDKGFNDIFYSDVRFGNLTPAVPSYENGNDTPRFDYTFPAPRYLAKIKAAKDEERGIHNVIGKEGDGKQYKPLKKGYISKKYGLVTPETKIVYHNANINTKDDGLYMQYCLSSGQYFSGTISGPEEKIKRVAELFFDKDKIFDSQLRFGRSKTAQYALCTVCEFKKANPGDEQFDKTTEDTAAFRLESDVYLTENGAPAVSVKALCAALGVDSTKLESETSVAVKTVSGYNAKRNMKNPQFPVYAAGSVLVFKTPSGFVAPTENRISPKVKIIGEKRNEGFGRVVFIADAAADKPHGDKPSEKTSPEGSTSAAELIERNTKLDEMQALGINNAAQVKLNPSQIGRLTLMAKEADRTPSGKFIDFEKRVYSIKGETASVAAKASFGEKALRQALKNSNIVFSDCSVPAGKDGTDKITLNVSDDQWRYVYKYILTVLTVRKYQLRKEGKDNE